MNCIFAPFGKLFLGLPNYNIRHDLPALPAGPAIPAEFTVDGKALSSQELDSALLGWDLSCQLENPGDGALLFLPFEVTQTAEFRFGLGGDWWARAAIDGQVLVDTFGNDGNGAGDFSPANHTVNLTLAAGRHLLAIAFYRGSNCALLLCALAKPQEFDAAVRASIEGQRRRSALSPDFAHPLPAGLKPLQGLCNGPKLVGQNMDVSTDYQRLNPRWIRLHDSMHNLNFIVDLPGLFPRFDADLEDPANYIFGPTEEYLQACADIRGAQIILRLGTSIENDGRRYFVRPPKDFHRWARLCVQVLRHFNDGWANGLHLGIQYLEIWNEACDHKDDMWCGGTFQQYIELYEVSARALKAYNPALKLGGPVGVTLSESQRFLAYCHDHQVPLDFFSWHSYALDPKEVMDYAHEVEKLLRQFGFESLEVALTEWNLLPQINGAGLALNRAQQTTAFQALYHEQAAAYCAAVLCQAQDVKLDIATYYDGQPECSYCGIFDESGARRMPYYALLAFAYLCHFPHRVTVRLDRASYDLSAAAAIDAEAREAAVLLVRYRNDAHASSRRVWLDLSALPSEFNECEILLIDHDHCLQTADVQELSGDRLAAVYLQNYSVALLRIHPRANRYLSALWNGN